MLSPYFTVVEIYQNKLLQAIICECEDVADATFAAIVTEYGVEPDEEMITEGIFENEDGYTVQIQQMNANKT